MNDVAFERPGPMPFRLLLDEAIRQARRHFRVLYPSVAIPLAVTTTLLAAAQALWVSRVTADLGSLRSPWSPQVYLLVLVNVGLLVVAIMALQAGALDALSGRPVDMKRAWRFAARGRVLITLLLSYVASILSVFCCCIPALFVVPLLSFIPPVMVEEGRFGFDSFARSSELALYDSGRGFLERPLVKVFLLLFVGVLVSYLLGLLVALPFQIPMYVDMFRKAAAGEDMVQGMPTWLWLQVPAQFLNALVSSAVYLYMSFGIALLYFDTRGRKEGSDLRSEIGEVFPPSAPPPGELPL
jgi:hypothetical protein